MKITKKQDCVRRAFKIHIGDIILDRREESISAYYFSELAGIDKPCFVNLSTGRTTFLDTDKILLGEGILEYDEDSKIIHIQERGTIPLERHELLIVSNVVPNSGIELSY